jgi:hypothetical protein
LNETTRGSHEPVIAHLDQSCFQKLLFSETTEQFKAKFTDDRHKEITIATMTLWVGELKKSQKHNWPSCHVLFLNETTRGSQEPVIAHLDQSCFQ